MKTISSSVNYFHPKVWLRPNLFLCNGFELRQNQDVILEEKAQILYRCVSVDSTGHMFIDIILTGARERLKQKELFH